MNYAINAMNQGRDGRKLTISPWKFVLILIGVSVYFIFGQFFFPLWILPLPPIAIFIGIYLIKRESVSLSIFILTVTLIQLKSEHSGFSIFDALAGMVVVGILAFLFVKKIFFANKYSLESNEYNLFFLSLIWIIVIGISNLIFSDTKFESWFRDSLVFSPLIVIPWMFLSLDLNKRRDSLLVYGVMLLIWIICIFVSIVNLRSSLLVSTYLFEITYHGANLISGPFMIFVFFHLLISEEKKKKKYFLFLGLLISIASMLLVKNRTIWILTITGICLTPFFLQKQYRKNSYKVFALLFIIFIFAITILYFRFPFFRIFLKFFISYLQSSSNLRTDPSLVGRYIEWRYAWEAIRQSPLVGYGVGSTYHTYNWFLGYFINAGYTHNGYLGTLLKGGIIGFILLFLAYIGFIRKGIVLLRIQLLGQKERAFIRAGITILLLLLIATTTFNMFAHRDVLLYVGLIWGYFLYIERTKVRNLQSTTTKTSVGK